jgi:hypothetical protein
MEGRALRVRRVVLARGQSGALPPDIRGRAERVPPSIMPSDLF